MKQNNLTRRGRIALMAAVTAAGWTIDVQQAHATFTATWLGANSTFAGADGLNFANAANWATDLVPGVDDTAVFNSSSPASSVSFGISGVAVHAISVSGARTFSGNLTTDSLTVGSSVAFAGGASISAGTLQFSGTGIVDLGAGSLLAQTVIGNVSKAGAPIDTIALAGGTFVSTSSPRCNFSGFGLARAPFGSQYESTNALNGTFNLPANFDGGSYSNMVFAGTASALSGVTTLNSGILAAQNGFVVNGTDQITGAGVVVGTLTDNTTSGALVPTAVATVTNPVYFSGLDIHVLSTGSAQLTYGFGGTTSTTGGATHIFAPNGAQFVTTLPGTTSISIDSPIIGSGNIEIKSGAILIHQPVANTGNLALTAGVVTATQPINATGNLSLTTTDAFGTSSFTTISVSNDLTLNLSSPTSGPTTVNNLSVDGTLRGAGILQYGAGTITYGSVAGSTPLSGAHVLTNGALWVSSQPVKLQDVVNDLQQIYPVNVTAPNGIDMNDSGADSLTGRINAPFSGTGGFGFKGSFTIGDPNQDSFATNGLELQSDGGSVTLLSSKTAYISLLNGRLGHFSDIGAPNGAVLSAVFATSWYWTHVGDTTDTSATFEFADGAGTIDSAQFYSRFKANSATMSGDIGFHAHDQVLAQNTLLGIPFVDATPLRLTAYDGGILNATSAIQINEAYSFSGHWQMDGTLSPGFVSNSLTINDDGTLAGSPTILSDGSRTLSLAINGTLAPGTASAVGHLQSSGDITLGSLSTSIVKVASISSFDQITTAGVMNLGGTLQVKGLNGNIPLPGQSFTVFQFGSSTGDVASIDNETGLAGLFLFEQLAPTSLSILAAGSDGDANLDGNIDSADFVILANHFGQTAQNWLAGDFNGDGIINALDFNALATNFGSGPASSPTPGAVVPEPALSGLIALALLLGRRRRGP